MIGFPKFAHFGGATIKSPEHMLTTLTAPFQNKLLEHSQGEMV